MMHAPIVRDASPEEERAVRAALPHCAAIQQLRQEFTDPELTKAQRDRIEQRAAELREKVAELAAGAGVSATELERLCAAEMRARGQADRSRRATATVHGHPRSVTAASRALAFVEQAIARNDADLADLRTERAKVDQLVVKATPSVRERLCQRRTFLVREIDRISASRARKVNERDHLLRTINGDGL